MNESIPRVEFIPLKPAVRLEGETRLEVLFRLHAPERERGRPRLNLGLALDRSGSMAGGKLKRALEAAAFLVQELGPQDRLAIVAYDDQIEQLLPSSPVTDKPALLARLRGVHHGGSTNLFEGWREAAYQVAQHLDPAALNRVLLLTDGLANQGLTQPEAIAQHVGELARRGVSTTTLGIGRDFNEDLLVLMADRGGGQFYFVESAADLPRIFAQELSGLSATFAKGVRLALMAPGVQVRLHNAFAEGPQGQYQLPDLIRGLPLELAFSLLLPPGPFRGELWLSWEDEEGRRQELRLPLALEAVGEAEFQGLPEHPEVLAYLAKLEVTRLRQEAVAWLDRGMFQEASATIQQAAPMLRTLAGHYAEEVDELQALSTLIEEDHLTARKRMLEQTLRNLKGRRGQA